MKWQADSKILLQGVHHPLSQVYIQRMQAVGTQLVAGVSAGHRGETLLGIPVFDLVEEAVNTQGPADASLILNPPYRVLDACLEAMAAGIRQLVIVSEGVPPLDMIQLLHHSRETNTFVLGSGSQGLMLPGQLLVGTFMPHCYQPGPISLVSHSDALTDEVAYHLTQAGWGQSWVVSLGTDALIGSNFEQWLQVLEEDEQTQAIVLVGQPTGQEELRAAHYIASAIEKPVIAYLAGCRTQTEKQVGDSLSTIAWQLSHPSPGVAETLQAFAEAQIPLSYRPWELPSVLEMLLNPGP
jgi:succinyl-CoA synthetase alpha subunit